MEATQTSVFHTQLPTEVSTQIFQYFSPRELSVISLVCKLFNEIASSNLLWKNICLKENRNVAHCSPTSWKESYKKNTFPFVKKAFMQIVKAKPNLQPIDQNAYDLKLNGKKE